MNNVFISAIIPVYNEEATIKRVIDDLSKIDILNEIIVVEDGSKDSSKKILQGYIESNKIRLIFNEKNKGKGYSVAQGLDISQDGLVIILDADIINYTKNDLILLVDPILAEQCDYTMKMTDNSSTKYISGVRAYRRSDLIPLLNHMKNTTRYGLEVMLNKHLNHKKGRFVLLKDYKHFQKFEKYPLSLAIWEYLKEGVSILVQKIKQ
jgi:glycosyltransferase involved in cell wall biosynthesis